VHARADEAATLLAGLRSGTGDEGLGSPFGEPILVIDVDGGDPVDLRIPSGWPCVVVAVSAATAPPPVPVGPDVFLSAAADPPAPWVGVGSEIDQATRRFESAVGANPQAATALAQIVRLGVALDPAQALVVESLAYSTLQAGPEHHSWLEDHPDRRADDRTDPAVTIERQADELWLTLERPERRNAFSARMRDDLVAALRFANLDPANGAIHLQGSGPSFCSGGDLGEFGTLADPATAHGIRTMRSAAWWMNELADRITVHLRGTCVGAGIELAAFAGLVEAAPDTRLILPEVGMGLVPGAGGTASIPRRIGPARTAWLAISGEPLDAHTALSWGLVDRLTEDVTG
jgi:enoyl-CoA hydratase/carnithine racemase